MITIYAEKPSVAKIIASSLNEKGSIKREDGYLEITYNGEPTYVTWGYGHLCELKQAYDYDEDYKNWANLPLPYIPSSFETKVKKDVYKQYKVVSDLFKKSDELVNATDLDREGELIFYYVYTTLKCKKPFKRANLQSLTPAGVKDCFKHLQPSSSVKNITDAGRARSIADWLVGSNATVAMTLGYSTKDILSIGRVQTPTLNILVKREKEIQAFKVEKYWMLDGEFTTPAGNTYRGTHEKTKFKTKKEADDIFMSLSKKPCKITSVQKKTEKRNVPNLYNLSALQMACNGKYGYTLQQTLDITQRLYEKGFVTYPRTDSQYLTEDMEPVVNTVLNTLALNSDYKAFIDGRKRVFDKPHYFCDKKVTSHYAIIPTNKIPSGLDKFEANVYDIIARSVIMMLYSPATIERTTVITSVDSYDFISKGSIVKKAEWLAVNITPTKEEVLPSELAEELIVTGNYKTTEKETKPPKRYTDLTLLKAMLGAGKDLEDEELRKVLSSDGEKGGIGTEATRASIVETLIKRGFVERDKKNLIPTERGIRLIDTIPIEDIKSPIFTGKWELRLNKIANNEDSFDSFINDIETLITKWCKEIKVASAGAEKIRSASSGVTSIMCPVCGKPLRKMKWGWGCSGYKDGCSFSVSSSICSKKLTETQVKQLVTKGSTNKISGFKSKAGKNFSAKLILDADQKIKFEF